MFALSVLIKSLHSSHKRGIDDEKMTRACPELVVFVAQAMMMVFACWLTDMSIMILLQFLLASNVSEILSHKFRELIF